MRKEKAYLSNEKEHLHELTLEELFKEFDAIEVALERNRRIYNSIEGVKPLEDYYGERNEYWNEEQRTIALEAMRRLKNIKWSDI